MRSLALTISMFLALLGCTEKSDKPVHPHESSKLAPTAPPVILDTPENTTPSGEAPKWEAAYKAAKDPLKDVLLRLADRVLDKTRVMDPASLHSRPVQDELIEFNHMILQT